MIAKWTTPCAKCGTPIERGAPMKAQYKRSGFDADTGKPIWIRVPKAYVHAPKCPKVTPNKPGQKPPPGVDPQTGEILVESSPLPRHTVEQGSLFA